jgi:acetylornithine deacetylase/succinyl-diaminopimelate desuccinylase-like protein
MFSFTILRRPAVAYVATVVALLTATQLEAQHRHPPPRPDSARADTARRPVKMPGMRMAPEDTAHDEHAMHTMHARHEMAGPLGISMDRMGSGTTWIPDEVTLPSRHLTVGDWRLMLHGFLFGQYNRQGGPRGDDQFGSLNWAMLMADHALAGGRIQFRTMLSLDPATAVTIFQAGTKENVLASRARAVINFRILPGDSVAGVVEHVRRVINDPRVEVIRVGGFSAEPSAVSSTDSESFHTLERTIRSVAPDAIVAPYLVVVVTDARYYREVSRNIFRFMPVRLTSRDLERMHGTNERIAVRDYERAVRLYRQLILNAAGGSTTPARVSLSTWR